MVWVACGSTSDEDAVQRLNADYASAMNDSNVEVLVSLMTHDVVMMPPGAPPVRGLDAARATFEVLFEQVTLHESWTTEEIVVVGDTAYDWSGYVVTITPRGGGEVSSEKGQNLFVARRQSDGSWRYSRMIWNSDGPPSGG